MFRVSYEYVQMFVVHPLFIVTALLYGLQAFRFFFIKLFYKQIPSLVGKDKASREITMRKFKFFEKLTSRITFTVITVAVMLLVYLEEIILLICGLSLDKFFEFHRISELIADI